MPYKKDAQIKETGAHKIRAMITCDRSENFWAVRF